MYYTVCFTRHRDKCQQSYDKKITQFRHKLVLVEDGKKSLKLFSYKWSNFYTCQADTHLRP